MQVFPTRQEWMKAGNKAELEKTLSDLVTQVGTGKAPLWLPRLAWQAKTGKRNDKQAVPEGTEAAWRS